MLYFQLRSALFSPSVICLFVIFFARRSYRTSIICVVFSIFSYRIAAFRRSSIALVAAMYQKGAFATMSFATCCAHVRSKTHAILGFGSARRHRQRCAALALMSAALQMLVRARRHGCFVSDGCCVLYVTYNTVYLRMCCIFNYAVRCFRHITLSSQVDTRTSGSGAASARSLRGRA